jgi:hypothetical protein
MSEQENIDQLFRFLLANRECTFDEASGAYAFSAWVTYHHSSKTITFQTEATIDTSAWDGGTLSLVETAKCPSSQYHLDFRARWASMNHDCEANLLIISGKSAKLGDYKVTIAALERR